MYLHTNLYISTGLPKSKQPSSKSYMRLKNGIENELTIARLEMFCFIASILEPFLTIFQSPEPQVPYLCNNIQKCLCQLMQLIVKPAVMDGIKNPMDYITIDILLPIAETDAKNKNLLPSKKFTIGFAAESEITRLQEADLVWLKDISSFRKNAKKFIIGTIHKIRERNPLQHAVRRNADCFDPNQIREGNPSAMRQKMKNICTNIATLKLMPFDQTDKALAEYAELLYQR